MMVAAAAWLVAACAQHVMAEQSYLIYQSTHPQLPIRFEYPQGWHVEESEGSTEAYTQVQVFGPGSLEGRMHTFLAVRAVPPRTHGGRYASVDELVESYRRTLMPTLAINRERRQVLLDAPATVLEVRGILYLPWKAADPQPVPIQSQRVFFEKDGRLYELSWIATPETADALAAAFDHLLQTLTVTR